MTRINVALGARAYPILIGNGLLRDAGAHLLEFSKSRRLVVVSDENVWGAQGAALIAGLKGIEIQSILLPPGEGSKDWGTLAKLIDQLTALDIGRGDHIVAFGGGVVGDITGFAASILKRGCGYVQIPTSLLAQVDSSVGGKTAINIPAGKNMVGSFHQPSLVLIDPATLGTLPARELRAGYAEIVKYGLIGDPGFFDWCEANGAALLAGDSDARLHAIETSVRAKAAIVAEDEREVDGRRALLNLGHTFAHALEAEAGYSDALLHGEAVAIGMVLAFDFSVERSLCPAEDAARAAAHLRSVGLPTATEADGRALAGHIMHDKKHGDGHLRFILARGIGKAFIDDSVTPEEVARFLSA